jgi:hypothetical protein
LNFSHNSQPFYQANLDNSALRYGYFLWVIVTSYST